MKMSDLWAIHYPKRDENVMSKTLCLTLYYMVTDRAYTIVDHEDWSDKLHVAIVFFGVPQKQFYQFAKENEDP
jgi:hypothetical protein